MSIPVVARSLSAVTNLAANPPQYPRNITHEPLQPLTLYIVRVPGSQDVFLTPLKPSTKASISAEALNTSLYYLHVSTPEDDALRKSLEAQRAAESPVSPTTSIHRKPLPQTQYSNESVHQRPPNPPKSYPDYQPLAQDAGDDTQFTRQVFRGQNVRLSPQRENIGSSISRKPLGPRPLQHPRIQSDDRETVQRKPVGSTEGRRSRANTLESVQQSPTANPPAEASTQDPSRGYVDGFDQPASRVDSTSNLHITIIRRDPSSGIQWNIGTIASSNNPAIPESSRIRVQITTPGYQKFTKENSFPKLEDLDISSPTRNKENRAPQPSTLDTSDSVPPILTDPEPQVFTRYLTLPRPRINRPKTSRRRSSSDPSSLKGSFSKLTSPPPPPQRPPVHIPRLDPVQSPQLHFSFQSPWQGTCSFTTTMNGRSLKCRHVLPSTTNDALPPAPVIAELRFNLPWPTVNFGALLKKEDSQKEGSDTRPSLADTAKASWRSSMQKIRERSNHNREPSDPFASTHTSPPPPPPQLSPRSSTQQSQHTRTQSSDRPDSDDSDSERESQTTSRHPDRESLDLSLGREKAGGGRGGQSAKLGKLIIRDEGLKMLDLVVGMGVGVWWRVNYRDRDRDI